MKAKYLGFILAAGLAVQARGQAIVDRPSFLTQSQEPDVYRYLPAPPDTSDRNGILTEAGKLLLMPTGSRTAF